MTTQSKERKKVMVIGPHPDDIELQVGGTIAKLTKEGHEVLILVVVPDHTLNEHVIKLRKGEAEKSAQVLGAKIKILDENPHTLSVNQDIVNKLDKAIAEFQPDEVYIPWIYDSHQHHQVVARATISATRRNKIAVYMYEQAIPAGLVPQSFGPTTYIDITETINEKVKSIEAHESQVKKYEGIIEASVGRASFRGFQVGVKYAETFCLVKEIKKV